MATIKPGYFATNYFCDRYFVENWWQHWQDLIAHVILELNSHVIDSLVFRCVINLLGLSSSVLVYQADVDSCISTDLCVDTYITDHLNLASVIDTED